VETLKFDNATALDVALADQVATRLERSIERCGSASLVVSGGRTPLGFFHELSQRSLDWSKVLVTLADERWVDNSHSDSNEKLVRGNLLINKAAEAEFVPLKNGATSAQLGQTQIDTRLAALGEFTVVILGMGNDGHTASLFPGAEALSQGLDMASGRSCLAVMPLEAPHERISLTLPRLLQTEHLVIHICGAEKQKVLEDALGGDDIAELPIRAVIQQNQCPVTVFWAS
jgi:6-phosphogluconolactonase